MTCSLCRRHRAAERLPRGWKARGPTVFCPDCRRRRFRLRFVTMTVAEPVGTGWEEFQIVLEKVWRPALALDLTDGNWELTTFGGRRIVRVFIGDRWWDLRLFDTQWSRGRREAYEAIAGGQAGAGEFTLYRRPAPEGLVRNDRTRDSRPYEVECKTVAWIPRELAEDSPSRALPATPDPKVRNQSVGEVNLARLRRAIRDNRISFPSQVPIFPGCGRPDLQHKLVQLYFVMGWSCASIAARYGLVRQQVRDVLSSWKQRAANTGYLQHIPSEEVIGTSAPAYTPVRDPEAPPDAPLRAIQGEIRKTENGIVRSGETAPEW